MKNLFAGITLLAFLFAASLSHAQDDQPKDKVCKKVWTEVKDNAKQSVYVSTKVCK